MTPAWDLPQVSEGERGPSCRKRRCRRCSVRVLKKWFRLGTSASPKVFEASWCRDGSLAVTQPISVQESCEESSSCGSVHSHPAGDVHASFRVSDVEEQFSDRLVFFSHVGRP